MQCPEYSSATTVILQGSLIVHGCITNLAHNHECQRITIMPKLATEANDSKLCTHRDMEMPVQQHMEVNSMSYLTYIYRTCDMEFSMMTSYLSVILLALRFPLYRQPVVYTYFFAGLARTYLLYSCFLDRKNLSAGGISSGSLFLSCKERYFWLREHSRVMHVRQLQHTFSRSCTAYTANVIREATLTETIQLSCRTTPTQFIYSNAHLGCCNPLVHFLHVLSDGPLPFSCYSLMLVTFRPLLRMLNGFLGCGGQVFVWPFSAPIEF